MERTRKRCRFWALTGVLALLLLGALSISNLALGAATSKDHIPRKLWSTYPLGLDRGQPRLERRPAAADVSGSPRNEELTPTTPAARDGVAHYSQQQSSRSDRVYVIGIALAAALSVLAVILAMTWASRPLRDVMGALPSTTIMAYASVIILSVAVGIGVVLILSPALGP